MGDKGKKDREKNQKQKNRKKDDKEKKKQEKNKKNSPLGSWSTRKESSMNFKLIFALILACLAVIFIIQNAEMAEVRFLVWSIKLSRSLLMFLLLAGGVIIGWFLNSYSKYHKSDTK